MHQPSATAAASAMPRRFCPPSQIGGPPGVSGGGLVRRPSERVERVRPRHARRRAWPRPRTGRASTCTADSKRSKRSGMGGSGIPNGTCSPSCQPAPRPTMNRPPVAWSRTRRRLREHGRMAERVRQHAVAEPLAGDAVGERRHRRERLQARAAALAPRCWSGGRSSTPTRTRRARRSVPRPRRGSASRPPAARS